MSKPTLTYFNGRGLAESSRLIFADAGVEFQDVRVSEKKEADEKLMAFGQLPVLQDDGLVIAQSNTIARYLAKKFGYYGKDIKQDTIADMVVDGLSDLSTQRIKVYNYETKSLPDSFKTETLPKWWTFYENIVAGPYITGQNISYADFILYNMIFNFIGYGWISREDFQSKYPKLHTLYTTFEARPNIAKYLAARPQTQF